MVPPAASLRAPRRQGTEPLEPWLSPLTRTVQNARVCISHSNVRKATIPCSSSISPITCIRLRVTSRDSSCRNSDPKPLSRPKTTGGPRFTIRALTPQSHGAKPPEEFVNIYPTKMFPPSKFTFMVRYMPPRFDQTRTHTLSDHFSSSMKRKKKHKVSRTSPLLGQVKTQNSQLILSVISKKKKVFYPLVRSAQDNQNSPRQKERRKKQLKLSCTEN